MLHAPHHAFALYSSRGACSFPGSGSIGMDDLLLAWRSLEGDARLPTQGPAFAEAAIGMLPSAASFEVYTYVSGGNIEALVPLSRDGGYLSRWNILGAQQVFEPTDVLCRDPAAVRQLAGLLARQPRPLSFERVPATSPLVPALREAMRGRGLVSVRPAVPCPVIELDEGWRNPESRFNSGRRSDFRRAMRKAEELGEVSFEVFAPEFASFDSVFDEAIKVEMSGWKNEAGTAIANDTKKEDFFRTFFRSANEEGRFRAAFMRIAGRAVAMQLAVEFADRYWLFKIGYDEEFRKCSPGTLLMLHTLRYAAERDFLAYEFLGNCEPWIADFWTDRHHDCVRIRTYPFNVRGLAALSADGLEWLRARFANKWG